jgi:DNA-directed RNA polymerase subunit omega
MVEKGGFLESAEFLGERYGTPWPDPPPGSDILLEIDLQGAEQVIARHPDSLLVLLLPPSPEVQAERLRGRGEDPETIAARLEVGREEEARGRRIADAVVVNADVDQAVAQVAGILERYRTPTANRPGGDPLRRIPMARRRPTLMDPPVESLLDKVDSKFTLVALSSKRARQINSYYNQLGESLGVIVPPQVTSVSGKPLTIAFEEIAISKTTYHRPDPEELEGGESGESDDADTSGLEPGELTLGGVTAGANEETSGSGVSDLSEAGEPPDSAS